MLRKKAQDGSHLASTIKIASGRVGREAEERCYDENESRVGNECEVSEEVGLKYKVLTRNAKQKDEEMF